MNGAPARVLFSCSRCRAQVSQRPRGPSLPFALTRPGFTPGGSSTASYRSLASLVGDVRAQLEDGDIACACIVAWRDSLPDDAFVCDFCMAGDACSMRDGRRICEGCDLAFGEVTVPLEAARAERCLVAS